MARTAIHELPPHYHEIKHVVLTEDKLLIRLNILALVPLLIMLVWMAIWWVIVSAGGRAPSVSIDIPWWLAIIAIILIVLPLHELLHGLTITAFGHQARYGMKLSKGVLYATSESALFRRNEYIAIALAPLVGITLAAMLLMLIVPQGLAYYVGIAAVLNAGGAIGDLWSTWLLLRYPSSVLVRDEADGFRIYAAGSGYAEGSSIQNSAPPSAG
jgi:hypothetical protein